MGLLFTEHFLRAEVKNNHGIIERRMSTRNEYNLILFSSKFNDFIETIVIVFSCAIFVKIDEQKITINRYSFVFTGEVVRVWLIVKDWHFFASSFLQNKVRQNKVRNHNTDP